jgi:hypothetical protein
VADHHDATIDYAAIDSAARRLFSDDSHDDDSIAAQHRPRVLKRHRSIL